MRHSTTSSSTNYKMSASGDLIDFEIIENQKENIQSLPGGRSARNLANLFSPSPLHKHSTPTPSDTQNLNDTIRKEYEDELENIAESDDPLDIYDRYVRWTLDAYPSAQATPQSQLLPLLERATKTFLNSTQYKNDPRYLKLWLLYIRFFSDSPRETFAFLARHNIGENLALFYEEFAAWLEAAGRWIQAEEVYKLGIEKESRPAPRLLRKFNEFQQRFAHRPEDQNEPSSPALPTVRPALAAKLDPFATAAGPRDPQAPRPSAGVGGSTTKSGRQKLTIFADAEDAPPAVSTPDATKGWQSIGSLADRKKENAIEAKPWAGETLKAGGKKSSTKLAVFKDESLVHVINPQVIIPSEQQVTVNPRNGRSERIFVNLEAVYPMPEKIGTELSFEELRAAHRGWLTKSWQREGNGNAVIVPLDQTEEPNINVGSTTREVVEKIVVARDSAMLDENGLSKEPLRETKGRKMKIKEVNETQIIKAKLSSPSGPKLTKRKSSKEPTMTLHTRAATDEIYDLFSQPLKRAGEEEDEEEEEDSEEEDDDGDMTDGDYTSGGESTATGRLITTSEAGDDETSDVRSVSEWSEFTARKHIPDLDDGEDTRISHMTGNTGAEDEASEKGETGGLALKNDNENESRHEGEDSEVEESLTPIEPPPAQKEVFVPIPPEDYVPPTRPYRDAIQMSQNRLPFMTPIAEKTESSLGVGTYRGEKQDFDVKTPSKVSGALNQSLSHTPERGLDGSLFQDLEGGVDPSDKIPQPRLKLNTATSAAPKAQVNGGAFAKDISQKQPIVKDAQCNPVDDLIRHTILDNLQPPLSTYEGFHSHKDETRGQSTEIRKYTKAVAKLAKNVADKTATSISTPPILRFLGTEREYAVKRELGAGAFAPVYLVENVAYEDKQNESQNQPAVMGRGKFDHLDRKKLEALKMEDPPSVWEFYIMRQAKRRLGISRAAESIINAYEMHLYQDECYLIEEYRDQGTLLDIINIARADSTTAGGVMDESLVIFFTIELFRTIEALHAKGLLHGDLKADNCLIRFDTIGDEEVWSPRYRRDGTGGWNKKGVALIDFGRGIDMKVFRPDVQFIADWKTTPQDCAEMRELRPWTYQIDYHGLAGIIHSMLFGKYIDTVADKGSGIGAAAKKSWKIKEAPKRYWQVDIWNSVFDLLLNPGMHIEGEEGTKLPILRGMKAVRENMETWLEANSEKGVGLQAGIRKLEHALHSRRK
ncbi:Mad3/BUB1 homology region 1-domain-containing protein [Xylogone sp. PMI_703]|nr:Mad3/BUB1 homology region 1-domain-containing protein [Xylogone sp. PMI_703]